MHEHRFFNDLNLNANNSSDFNAFENSALEKKNAFEKNVLEVSASDFSQKKKRLLNHKEKTVSKREKKIIFHREGKIVFNREGKFVSTRKEKNLTFINRIKIMQENNTLNELY